MLNCPDSYWAGIFDGEGNIYFAKDLVHIKVGVTQKEPKILYLMEQRFGGKVYTRKNVVCSRWEIGGKKEMVAFLEAVKPFLIIKRVEAEIALDALSGWRQSRYYNKGMNEPLPQEEMERRRALKEKFDADRSDPKLSPIT